MSAAGRSKGGRAPLGLPAVRHAQGQVIATTLAEDVIKPDFFI
jgi:hypothetical protein